MLIKVQGLILPDGSRRKSQLHSIRVTCQLNTVWYAAFYWMQKSSIKVKHRIVANKTLLYHRLNFYRCMSTRSDKLKYNLDRLLRNFAMGIFQGHLVLDQK